jgi:hypothetical protein
LRFAASEASVKGWFAIIHRMFPDISLPAAACARSKTAAFAVYGRVVSTN